MEDYEHAVQLYRLASYLGTAAIVASYVATFVLGRRYTNGDREMAKKYPFGVRVLAGLTASREAEIEPVDRPFYAAKRRTARLVLAVLAGALCLNFGLKAYARANLAKFTPPSAEERPQGKM